MSDDASSVSSSSSTDSEDVNDLNNPDIITKYRLAGDFATNALNTVIQACQPGAKVLDLCKLGDETILAQTKTVYTKQVVVKGEKTAVDKGIAFPTSVSVNHYLGNFCPRDSDPVVLLEDGDVVKIEVGVHIDGYVANSTHTVVVGAADLTGRKADVVAAAHTALEGAMRLLKPGTKSTAIPELVKRVAESYEVSSVESVKCCTMKRFVVEGNKQVPIRSRVEDKTEDFTIEIGEVYALELAFSTSEEGKCTDKDGIVSIFRRAVDVNYMLKLKAARQLFSDINTNSPSLPFAIRPLEEKMGANAKLGLREIVQADMLIPYPVLQDKAEETIATFKATCLVMPSGVIQLVNAPQTVVKSDKKPDKQTAELLQTSLKKSKKKKKKAAK